MRVYVGWIAAALLGSGCAPSGVRLRDAAPVVFREVLGEDGDARFVYLGKGATPAYAPAAQAQSGPTLYVHQVAGSLTPVKRAVVTGSERGSIEVGLDLHMQQLVDGERPPAVTLALPRRIYIAVSSVAAIPEGTPPAHLPLRALQADVEARRVPPLRLERVDAGTFRLTNDGIEWSIAPRLAVPADAASWDPRTGLARFIVSWMIEHASGQYSFGAIASTASQ